jgi:hypothetical protein
VHGIMVDGTCTTHVRKHYVSYAEWLIKVSQLLLCDPCC